VSEAKLTAAMQKLPPSGTSRQAPGANFDPASTLAKELGLSEARVRAGMQSLRPSGAPQGAPPQGSAPPNGATPPQGGTAPEGTAPQQGTGSSASGTAA